MDDCARANVIEWRAKRWRPVRLAPAAIGQHAFGYGYHRELLHRDVVSSTRRRWLRADLLRLRLQGCGAGGELPLPHAQRDDGLAVAQDRVYLSAPTRGVFSAIAGDVLCRLSPAPTLVATRWHHALRENAHADELWEDASQARHSVGSPARRPTARPRRCRRSLVASALARKGNEGLPTPPCPSSG